MTGTKKSSPDMFNFYLASAGHDILRLPRAGENSKPHDYKQKCIKWRNFRKHGFLRENSLNILDKKNRNNFLGLSKTSVGTPRPKTNTWRSPS